MSLNIIPSDVLSQLGTTFNSLWPILAIGLGLAATPKLIGAAKSVFSSKG